MSWGGLKQAGRVCWEPPPLSHGRLLEPDGAHDAPSQMERIKHVRHTSQDTQCSPPSPSPKWGENHKVTWEGSQSPGIFWELSGNYSRITMGDVNMPPPPPPTFSIMGLQGSGLVSLGNKGPVLGICPRQPYPLPAPSLGSCQTETLPAHCCCQSWGSNAWHLTGQEERSERLI